MELRMLKDELEQLKEKLNGVEEEGLAEAEGEM